MSPSKSQGSWYDQRNVFFEHCRILFDNIKSILTGPDTEASTIRRKRRRDEGEESGIDLHKRYRRDQTYLIIEALYTDSPPPGSDRVLLGRYLGIVPSIFERIRELHSRPARILSSRTVPDLKIINVLQGEIGHATARQADVIVSDRATTCHIVAVRSTPIDRRCDDALVSLCHIDYPGYENCLRDMMLLHKEHHNETSTAACEEEKKESDGTATTNINMELHIVGGFSDPNKSSLAITEYLIDLFGRLAEEEKELVKFTLKMCAVSYLNDNGLGAPIGRGLAMDLRSGEIYLASVDDSVAGPAVELRTARLWAGDSSQKLSVIHLPSSDTLIVEPFYCFWSQDLDEIMDLPDEDMLLETSTSPETEEDDYCERVRASLRYLRDNNQEDVFGPQVSTPLQYSRSNLTNEWKVIT